jgi:hypothetical protein
VWVLLALVLVLALGAVAIYLATKDDSSGGTGGASVSSSGSAPVIANATSFDPPPGDGQEDDAHVANVIPPGGSPPWSTERYQNPLQRNKPGVGVRLKLEEGTTISSVTVETDAAGWSGSIYVADAPGNVLSDWGSVRASGDDLGTTHRFDLGNVHGSYVLVWLTQLPQTADGGWQLRLREIRVA